MATSPNRNSFTSVAKRRCVPWVEEENARSPACRREIPRRRADVLEAGYRAIPEVASPKNGRKNFRIRVEKTRRDLVVPPRKSRSQFDVNMVVGKFSGLAQSEAPVFTTPSSIRACNRHRASRGQTWPDGIKHHSSVEFVRGVEPLQEPRATGVGKDGIERGDPKRFFSWPRALRR